MVTEAAMVAKVTGVFLSGVCWHDGFGGLHKLEEGLCESIQCALHKLPYRVDVA